jgi:hypothetical protein
LELWNALQIGSDLGRVESDSQSLLGILLGKKECESVALWQRLFTALQIGSDLGRVEGDSLLDAPLWDQNLEDFWVCARENQNLKAALVAAGPRLEEVVRHLDDQNLEASWVCARWNPNVEVTSASSSCLDSIQETQQMAVSIEGKYGGDDLGMAGIPNSAWPLMKTTTTTAPAKTAVESKICVPFNTPLVCSVNNNDENDHVISALASTGCQVEDGSEEKPRR